MIRLNEAGPAADPVCCIFVPTTGAAARTAGNPDLLLPLQPSCSSSQSSSAASEPASEVDGALRSRRHAVGTGCSAAGVHSSDWGAYGLLGRVAAVVANYRRRGRIRHVMWPPAYTSGRRYGSDAANLVSHMPLHPFIKLPVHSNPQAQVQQDGSGRMHDDLTLMVQSLIIGSALDVLHE